MSICWLNEYLNKHSVLEPWATCIFRQTNVCHTYGRWLIHEDNHVGHNWLNLFKSMRQTLCEEGLMLELILPHLLPWRRLIIDGIWKKTKQIDLLIQLALSLLVPVEINWSWQVFCELWVTTMCCVTGELCWHASLQCLSSTFKEWQI